MAFYKQPIHPLDPVVEDDKDSGASRYFRDTFNDTGQDSHTEPPAQDPSLWESLLNVMPITRGGLDCRWGYDTFAQSTLLSVNRLATFQRDTDQLRTIMEMGTFVRALGEDGSTYNPTVFTPSNTPRLVNSRSYGYFFSGNATDLQKWDGSPTGGVSNWGITFPSIIGTLSAGPDLPTIASAGAGWSNPTFALANDATYASATSATTTTSLSLSSFGFVIPIDATILGIVVEINARAVVATGTGSFPVFYWATLTKNGVPVGNTEQVALTPSTDPGSQSYFLGGSVDLWGTSWSPNDIDNSTFGVNIQGFNEFGGRTINFAVNYVTIKVFFTGNIEAIAVADGGAGQVTLTIGRIYYVTFNNSTVGHYSDLGPASASTGPKTNGQISLSTIPVSSDPQVDQKVILATSDGGDPSQLFQLAIIPNAQTTYTDNTPEDSLDLNQVYLFTDEFGNDFGVAGNTPPPTGSICTKHKGRLWMAVGQNLYFSKSITELTLPDGFIAGKYEECWPQDNFLDISEGAESMTGLLSNGQALFIATERHIRWVTGDDPSNFSEPEIIHAETGVLNQEVWQNVFVQGTPAGCIWLTPDRKVISSDFNSYHDIGQPIQDVLDTLNLASASQSHAMFVSSGEFDLYILAIPTGTNTFCDTHCAFNMRSQRWVVWQPNDPSSAMLFNVSGVGEPQWLFTAPVVLDGTIIATNMFQYSPTSTDDNGMPIPHTARTSWMHLGAPTFRKLLDELEVVGDPEMTVTVEGASPQGDFTGANIHLLKDAVSLLTSPFGQQKVYLATSGAKDRYYRLTFNSDTTTRAFLRSYALKSLPFNSL